MAPYGAFWFAVNTKLGVAMTTLNKYKYYKSQDGKVIMSTLSRSLLHAKLGKTLNTLGKYEYYISLGVSPYQALLWAGEPTLHVSRILYEQ